MPAGRHRESWFIRHSESVANAGARTREAPSYPLSGTGFKQAEQLAAALPEEPDLIVVSPYLRARQTAAPAIRRFHKSRVEVWPVHEVQYLAPEACVDTTQHERRELSREYWERADPAYSAPGAESFSAFIARAADAIQRLSNRPEQRVFVFSHGQFMSAIAWLTLSRPRTIDEDAMRRFYRFVHGCIVPNCVILPLHIHANGTHSLGGLWTPHGIEPQTDSKAEAGLAGV